MRPPNNEHLHNHPGVAPNPAHPGNAPDGRQRQQVNRIDTSVHQTTVINNNTFIQNNVLVQTGWYGYNGWWYYHHPEYYGLLGVFYGDLWFWTYYHQSHWWWYHPHYGRWLAFYDGRWWYCVNGLCSIWYENDDSFYAVYPDHVERENPNTPPAPPTDPPTNPPTDPPAPPPDQGSEQVYYSPDSTRAVYVVGPDKQAHLYTYPDLGHIAYLGSGVTRVSFTTDSANDDALVVYLEFSQGDPKWFDRDGNIYGSSSDPDPGDDGQSGLTRALQTTPVEVGASGVAVTDVPAVSNGAAVELPRTPRKR